MEQCWEGEKKSIPTDIGPFILRLYTNSFRGEESSLALEPLPAQRARLKEDRGG